MTHRSGSSCDIALAVAVDGSGDVLAAGVLGAVLTRAELAVLKLSGNDGAQSTALHIRI